MLVRAANRSLLACLFIMMVSGVFPRAEGSWDVSLERAARNIKEPNTPGKLLLWYRNETNFKVLWQPSYPALYKISIVPEDARDVELYVEKDGMADFEGLVPGRAYNISVQTEGSAPFTAQYHTVPLRPLNVTAVVDPPSALTVSWRPPTNLTDFDKYQVILSTAGRWINVLSRARTDPTEMRFDQLEPGATYKVTVKTVSGKTASWPAIADVTFPPLQARELTTPEDESGVS